MWTLRIHTLTAIGLLVCASANAAQVDVDTVVPGITGTSHSADSPIIARGYYSPGDGGGAEFARNGSCVSTLTGDPDGSVTIKNVSSTAGLYRGASIMGTGFTAGTWVTSFAPHTIWISQTAAAGVGISLTVGGGGGSLHVADSAGDCFDRISSLTGNIRESGATCDVQVFDVNDNANYSSGNDYIHVPSTTGLSVIPGDYISIAGIGTAPYYATRYSTLANPGSGYKAGDVVPFDSGTGYSQQIAIVVDAVGTSIAGNTTNLSNQIASVSGSLTGVDIGDPISGSGIPAGAYVTAISGTTLTISQNATATATGVPLIISGISVTGQITQWHFLHGGQYAVASGSLPTNPIAQASGGGTSGMNASLNASWSGWSVVEHGTKVDSTAMGSNYASGDLLQVAAVGSGQPIQIIVDDVGTGGTISSFHFANYGSYFAPPGQNLVAVTSLTGIGSGAKFDFQWSWGTFASTVASVEPTKIHMTDSPTLPSTYTNQNVLLWYFGHDDGAAINNEIANAPGVSQITIPAACGTTKQIEMPHNTGAGNANAIVAGLSQAASGLYALGINQAGSANFIQPMSHVIHKSVDDTQGGGIRDLTVEGIGLPQGQGQYLASTPTSSSTGSVVEVDAGDEMQIANVWIKDALGSGNAELACGIGSSDPNQTITSDVGDLWAINSRFETLDAAFSGAQNPDYNLEADQGCHDSYFTNMVAVSAGFANIRNVVGNHWISPHIFNALYPSAPGAANYGLLVSDHTRITDMQCDDANNACILLGYAKKVSGQRTTIYGLSMDCGDGNQHAGWSAPANYYGIEIANEQSQTNISGAILNSVCNIPSSQLIHLDGIIDPSVQIFGNAAATIAQFAAPGFAPQGRLTLASGVPVMTADVTNASTIYYAPYTGTYVPIYNGTNVVMYQFTSSPTDNVGPSIALNTTAHTTGHLYDLYAFNNGGTITLGTGPAWTSLTARGASQDVQRYSGILTNAVSIAISYGSPLITYTCPVNQCTYLGTVYATGGGTTCVQFAPTPANGGESSCGNGAFVGLWNACNRVNAHVRVIDNSAAWNAKTINTWEPGDYNFGTSHTNINNRINFLDGMQVVQVHATLDENNQSNGASSTKPLIGVSFDTTSTSPDIACKQQATQVVSVSCDAFSVPFMGLHFAQAMEQAAALTSTPFGQNLVTALDWEY